MRYVLAALLALFVGSAVAAPTTYNVKMTWKQGDLSDIPVGMDWSWTIQYKINRGTLTTILSDVPSKTKAISANSGDDAEVRVRACWKKGDTTVACSTYSNFKRLVFPKTKPDVPTDIEVAL